MRPFWLRLFHVKNVLPLAWFVNGKIFPQTHFPVDMYCQWQYIKDRKENP